MPETEQLQTALADAVAAGDADFIQKLFAEITVQDAAWALNNLQEEQRAAVLKMLPQEEAADLLEELSQAQAVGIVESMPAADAASIVEELESDVQADFLASLDAEFAEEVLSAMDPEDAAEARQLAAYPPDVAGGLMITEYVAIPSTYTVGDVVANLRKQVEDYTDYAVQYVYVVGEEEQLLGVLRLRDVLLTRDSVPVTKIMIADPMSVPDTATLDELKDLFDRKAFIGVPVLTGQGGLVGVARRDDVDRAIANRAGSDFLKSKGIVGGEELRSMPLLLRCRRRLSWLSVNILLNIMAASIIAWFEPTLSQVIALAVFLPIISDMSGCSGNQAMAVSARELTLGLIRSHELLRVWLKEITVGLINGLALGLLLSLAAYIWKGNAALGIVVGTALALNTIVAVSIGGTVPLILKRLKQDPALASGPILTTCTDMCGFFFALSFATAALPWLT